MIIRASIEMDIDVSDFNPEFIDIEGLAKNLMEREMIHNLDNKTLDVSDFTFEIVGE